MGLQLGGPLPCEWTKVGRKRQLFMVRSVRLIQEHDLLVNTKWRPSCVLPGIPLSSPQGRPFFEKHNYQTTCSFCAPRASPLLRDFKFAIFDFLLIGSEAHSPSSPREHTNIHLSPQRRDEDFCDTITLLCIGRVFHPNFFSYRVTFIESKSITFL